MKADDTGYVFGRRGVVGDVVGRHPIFIAPNITEQHEHEASQIENEFFDWNGSADGWDFATECGQLVWENEESVAKQQIEQETKRREHGDGSPKSLSRKFEIGTTC